MHDILFFINNHLILSCTWFVFLILMITFIIKDCFLQSKVINNFEAIKLINKENAVVIDTRLLENFEKGHIINSIHIPIENIFLGQIKNIESYKLSPIILIISQSNKFHECLKIFLKHEFKNIFILKNGINYWNADNLPLITKDKFFR